ncbi:hypothetical protein [Acinetobacter guillouiae]|uniref:hypothetical protein n=1 Tax=Acinetobacter guillouiae TaxID=106649 RepID=UPI003009DCE0
MKNNEIKELFSKAKLNENQNNKKNIAYSDKIKEYFIKNYKDYPEILSIYFNEMYAKKLININNNLDFVHRILGNSIFFTYFKESNLNTFDLVKILTIYNNSSKYFIDNLTKEEKLMNENLNKIQDSYNVFLNNSKKVFNFEKWFNEKSIDTLGCIFKEFPFDELEINEDNLLNTVIDEKIKSLVNFSLVFENYYKDICNFHKNKRSINLKEKNKNMNYFIRELMNIFNDLNSKKIPNKIIIELVYIIFEIQIDDKNLRNIIKCTNTHPSNTSYTVQFITQENNELEIEYIKSNKCL